MIFDIKKDQMTPKERMDAFSKGKEIDRVPCMPQMGVTMAPFIGVSIYDYYHNPELMARLEIELFKKFRHDSVGVGICLRGIAEAMGTKIAYPKNGISYVEEPVLKSIKEVNKLSPADPYKDGNIPLRLKALKMVKDALGDQVDVGSDMPAPFSAASDVLGTEKFLKAIIKNPKEVHQLLEVVTETNLRIIDIFANLGVGLCMSDPVASTSLIGVKTFREFAMPYQKRCIDRMREKSGKGATLHICGKSRGIWDSLVETGMTTLSLDNIEDMEEAKKVIGDKVCIVGNVDPVDTMKYGTKEDIIKEAKECLRKGYDSPKGFVLSTGCQIPVDSPMENIQTLMDVARSYGTYPLDPSKWGNLQKGIS